MTARSTRFALLTHVLPGMPSGQGIMLGRLLDGLPAGSSTVIGSTPAGAAPRGRSHTAGAILLPPDRPRRLGRALLPASTILRAVRVAAVVRRRRCAVLVACTGDLVNLPAGALAARLARVPFVAWYFDDYLREWPAGFAVRFATLAEALALRRARVVLAPNEFLADEVAARCAVVSAVVPNPLADSTDIPSAPLPDPAIGSEGIVYTGAVYEVNRAPFRTLIDALRRASLPSMCVDIFSEQAEPDLRAAGIAGPVRLHGHLSERAAVEAQRRAWALFLPLSLEPAHRPLLRTAAPAKLGEYLAAGRPILALVPPDSYVAWYLRHHACGLVVDDDDPDRLASALRQLAGDPALRQSLAGKALERARADFLAGPARARLATTLREAAGR